MRLKLAIVTCIVQLICIQGFDLIAQSSATKDFYLAIHRKLSKNPQTIQIAQFNLLN